MLPLFVLPITTQPLAPDQSGMPPTYDHHYKLEADEGLLQLTPDDIPAIKPVYESKMATLAKAAAPNRQAWCDAVCEGY